MNGRSATLMFKIRAWFFRATCRLDMLNTCATLFKILLFIMEIQPRHGSMHINIETVRVTLTFEIVVRFFIATHRLDMANT